MAMQIKAASAIMEAAIATERKRLWSTVRSWNRASCRVLEKLGVRLLLIWLYSASTPRVSVVHST